jgi:3'(2'), 5'-bisphosphate nucleotidase
MNLLPNISEIIKIAALAGSKILEVYNNEFLFKNNIEKKDDNSPLTLADKRSHDLIFEELTKLTPDIPIISEEGEADSFPYEKRRNWTRFWLVDPLDGTKEFIKRNGEFTVNIALIENGIPILGVIQIPCSGTVYYADNTGAYKLENTTVPQRIFVNNKKSGLISIASRSHRGESEMEFLNKFNITGSISAGSSIKFCYVAEGKADIYYREGHTMEWDTAAGQIIVEKAGGEVKPLQYNKPVLRNDTFCCYGFKNLE